MASATPIPHSHNTFPFYLKKLFLRQLLINGLFSSTGLPIHRLFSIGMGLWGWLKDNEAIYYRLYDLLYEQMKACFLVSMAN